MSIKKNLISNLYFPIKIFRSSKSFLTSEEETRLRVLLFHDIPSNSIDTFKRKMEFLSKYWNFITIDEFEDYLDGKNNLVGNNLLLSFDDGFYSNRRVVKEVLNPMGIKALFFIVYEFAKSETHKEQKSFIKEYLYPDWRGHSLPENFDEMKSLGFEDLNYLIQSGHTIGCHSATHKDLSRQYPEELLNKEIIESANLLEKTLDTKINHFSIPFGNVLFFNQDSLKIARSRFKYIHTGMRGDNAQSLNPLAIRRDTIAVDDSLKLMGAFLEGVADFRYKKDFEIYESWLI